MLHKILVAAVILAVACEAQHFHRSLSLDFSGNGIRRFNSIFTNSLDVISLNFENNEINELAPSTFSGTPSLLELNLARNRLNFANLSKLEEHRHLRRLLLDDNKDANLTEGPILLLENKFPGLLSLHARNCGIRDVASLAFAPNLEHLYLASNDLAASNLSFLNETGQRLSLLDLSDNGLQRLDAGSLSELLELRLDGNRFERLCASPDCDSGAVLALSGATKLRHLSLAKNAITSIDGGAFEDATELGYLDLSDNQIQSIDDGTFDKLIYLNHLWLKGNQLSEVPDIHKLTSLQNVSLAGNNLKAVMNGSFYENVHIHNLDLSHNQIEKVEYNAFVRQYYKLKTLNLSYNKLTSLHILYLQNLTVLYLNNNLLPSLDVLNLGNLRLGAQLREIHLQNNQINKIHSHSFNYKDCKRFPDITFIFFDAANSTVQSKSAEECKCDCASSNTDSLIATNSFNWP